MDVKAMRPMFRTSGRRLWRPGSSTQGSDLLGPSSCNAASSFVTSMPPDARGPVAEGRNGGLNDCCRSYDSSGRLRPAAMALTGTAVSMATIARLSRAGARSLAGS